MDDPLYDHQLDAYPPIPSVPAPAGPISRERSGGAAGPGNAKAVPAVWSPPRRPPPANPARGAVASGPTSGPAHGPGYLWSWPVGLRQHVLLGVGFAAGVLLTSPLRWCWRCGPARARSHHDPRHSRSSSCRGPSRRFPANVPRRPRRKSRGEGPPPRRAAPVSAAPPHRSSSCPRCKRIPPSRSPWPRRRT